jgi:hypothetical protein
MFMVFDVRREKFWRAAPAACERKAENVGKAKHENIIKINNFGCDCCSTLASRPASPDACLFETFSFQPKPAKPSSVHLFKTVKSESEINENSDT